MKQAYYKLLFVVLFLGIVSIITGTPESKACDKRSVKRTNITHCKQEAAARPGGDSSDTFFFISIFQI